MVSELYLNKAITPPQKKEGGGQRKKAQSKHPVPHTEYVIVSHNSITEILREIRLAPKPLLQNVMASFTSSISDRVLRERIQKTRVLRSTMVKQRNTKRSKKHHTGSRYGWRYVELAYLTGRSLFPQTIPSLIQRVPGRLAAMSD